MNFERGAEVERLWCEPVLTAYLRPDGGKGIRNKALILYTVECARHAAERIARHFRDAGEDVDVTGCLSCLRNQVILRRLLRYATHPNVGAVLVVGHGCEYLDPARIAGFAREKGREAEWFYLQEAGGTEGGIRRGIELVSGMLDRLREAPRGPMRPCELVVGAKCGGSDFTSGLAGNALVGALFESHVACGGAAMMEEMAEAVGLRDHLTARCASAEAARAVAATYDKTMEFCRQLGQYSISPGNFAGGLTTIEEKSLGAVCKAGNCPIQGVLKIAQAPPGPGFWLLDVIPDDRVEPAFFGGGDATGLMDQVASNCHLLLFVTGRGHVGGVPVSPVVKITGNQTTFDRMAGDIDLCAADLLTGARTMPEMKSALAEVILAVAGGRKTHAERLGHAEGTLFFNHQKPDGVCWTRYG